MCGVNKVIEWWPFWCLLDKTRKKKMKGWVWFVSFFVPKKYYIIFNDNDSDVCCFFKIQNRKRIRIICKTFGKLGRSVTLRIILIALPSLLSSIFENHTPEGLWWTLNKHGSSSNKLFNYSRLENGGWERPKKSFKKDILTCGALTSFLDVERPLKQ